MTDEIERKWLDEAARLAGYRDWAHAESDGMICELDSIRAHARTLREFDAFRREVSEAVTYCVGQGISGHHLDTLARFILPAPDPLADQLGPDLAAQVREKVPGAVKVETNQVNPPPATELLALAERIEQAPAEEQRELLLAAFVALKGIDPIDTRAWPTTQDDLRFYNMLGARAYIDAAMMLLPAGKNITVSTHSPPGATLGAVVSRWCYAATPALAVAAAALRARAEG